MYVCTKFQKNSNHEKLVILLMVPTGERWNYLELKNKFESHKKYRKKHIFLTSLMPSENTKILDFNQYKWSGKTPFIIYADLESLIEKIVGCKSNPCTAKLFHHAFQYLQYCHLKTENKHNVYRGKYWMKSFANP